MGFGAHEGCTSDASDANSMSCSLETTRQNGRVCIDLAQPTAIRQLEVLKREDLAEAGAIGGYSCSLTCW